MKYLLMYIWKLTYWISGIVIVVGMLIMVMDVSKMFIDSLVLQPIIAIFMWLAGSFILLKPLSMLDKVLETQASLDKDARISFFIFVTFVLISIAVFFAGIYTFDMWLELINEENRALDDYYTIIFPAVLFIASIASFMGSFKLYKKYQETIRGEEVI